MNWSGAPLRVALHLYPRSWRAQRERELLGHLADSAEDGGRGIQPLDLLDLAGHGIEARIERALRVPSRPVRAKAALLAAATGAAMAGLLLAGTETSLIATMLGNHPSGDEALLLVRRFGPFLSLGGPLDLLLVAVPLVWLVAGSGLARTLAAGTALGAAALPLLAAATGAPRPPLTILAVQSALAVLVAVGPLPRRRTTAGIVCLTALAATASALVLVDRGAVGTVGGYYGLGGLSTLDELLGPTVLVGVPLAAALALRRRGWLAAALLAAAPVLLLHEYVRWLSDPQGTLAWATGLPVIALPVAVAVAVARHLGLRLRLERLDRTRS